MGARLAGVEAPYHPTAPRVTRWLPSRDLTYPATSSIHSCAGAGATACQGCPVARVQAAPGGGARQLWTVHADVAAPAH